MKYKIPFARLRQVLPLLTLLVFVLSCVPQTKLEYLQDPVVNENIYQLHEKKLNTIKPNDELHIRVSSFDDVDYNFFSSQTTSSSLNYTNEVSINLISYTVNDSGYIYFPIIGNIYLKGLTIEDATEKLKNMLNEYFNQPIVVIKFVNKTITVLGEVNRPGQYFYTKETLNLFEALGLAGDLTIFGNRQEVVLLRTTDNTVSKRILDLTKDGVIQDKDFYLLEDDIIYVMPLESRKWGIISNPWSLTLSTLTTLLVILNFFVQ